MKWRLFLSPRAERELKKLAGPIRKRIDRAFLFLHINPYVSGVKKISDPRLAEFRIRIGDYRILYDVHENDRVIYVLRIGHRKDVYQ
jgi:mRNA interferase RelE/StbE